MVQPVRGEKRIARHIQGSQYCSRKRDCCSKTRSTGESNAVVEDPSGEAGLVVALERLGGKEVKLDIVAGRSCLLDWLGRDILMV
jgi:hypothetical protein